MSVTRSNLEIYVQTRLNYFHNAKAEGGATYGGDLAAIISTRDGLIAKERISRWPGYEPTPLHRLNTLAQAIGVKEIFYKDESSRFGLKSFKALGGAFAVEELLMKEVSARLKRKIPIEALSSSECKDICAQITIATATDGNHGRSVAWGTSLYGCRCVIYVHEGVSKGRKSALRDLSAEVRIINGNYDDSVEAASKDAAENGWFVVSDTSYEGYVEIPRNVMRGYTAMMQEIADEIDRDGAPTHIFTQGGVGGLATAVIGYFRDWLGPDSPQIIIVEPTAADCIYQSIIAGAPVTIGGQHESMMAGLCCGKVSMLAWPFIQKGVQHFITMPDDTVAHTMRMLAASKFSDAAIEAGESAVAGLSALISAALKPPLREALALDDKSRVLLFGTEGATDSEIYERIMSARES